MNKEQCWYKLITMTGLIFCSDFFCSSLYPLQLSLFNGEKCTYINSNPSKSIVENEVVNSLYSNSVWIIWNSLLCTRVILYSIGLLSEQPILSPITKRIQSIHSVNISTCEDSVRDEVFINCLRSSTKSQTQSFVAISLITSQQIIDCITPRFIFMGPVCCVVMILIL